MLSCSIWFSVPSFWMGGGLESRCIGRVYGADGARHHPHRKHHRTQRLSRPPPIQKLGAENHMLATQHLMLLMMSVCARNVSS